jgi:membrane protein implicated in regulation of membrane protease activity
MIEPLLWLLVSALLGLLCLAVVVWVVVTGRIAYLDGLSLALISLAVGAIFLSMLGWSYRSSELKELLKSLRSGRNDAPGDSTQQSA